MNNTVIINGTVDQGTETMEGTVHIMGQTHTFKGNMNDDESPFSELMDEVGEKYLNQFPEDQKFEINITIKPKN